MNIYHSIDQIEDKNLGITIGNFDGVHIGHRYILNEIQKDCKKNNLKSCLITFSPHPQQILNPRNNFLINDWEERRELILALGIDYLIEIPFNRDLSILEPEEFLSQYVAKGEKVKKFFIGHDFAFGKNKSGNKLFMKNFFKKSPTELVELSRFLECEDGVSSSVVRNLLLDGNVELADKYLQRNFFVSGTVVKGKGRGRILGFPTANIRFAQSRIIPKLGVYRTETTWKDMTFRSVTNVGVNPTFEDADKVNIETHLLDFDKDIYGEKLKVAFLGRIRDEKKFENVNELVSQVRLDIEMARNWKK